MPSTTLPQFGHGFDDGMMYYIMMIIIIKLVDATERYLNVNVVIVCGDLMKYYKATRPDGWDSVRDSVGASIWAYMGSLFPKIERWQYCENIRTVGYPFQPAVRLWKMGIVPSYDGIKWRLHTKNGIAWEDTL